MPTEPETTDKCPHCGQPAGAHTMTVETPPRLVCPTEAKEAKMEGGRRVFVHG